VDTLFSKKYCRVMTSYIASKMRPIASWGLRATKTINFVLLLCTLSACQQAAPRKETAELRQKLKTVTLADGISQSEAEVIGKSYFAKHVGCGAFVGIQDAGDRWIVDAKFGYAGEPIKGFFIDKRSGKLTSPVGPSYDNPLDIFP
jgi:hypothetical protein